MKVGLFHGHTDPLYGICRGANKVVNGQFAADLSAWTAGVGITWAAGQASFSGATGFLEQGFATVAGRSYEVTCDVGGQAIFMGAWSAAGQSGQLNTPEGIGTAAGRPTGTSVSFKFTATGATSYIGFSIGAGAATLDNVQVKEIS